MVAVICAKYTVCVKCTVDVTNFCNMIVQIFTRVWILCKAQPYLTSHLSERVRLALVWSRAHINLYNVLPCVQADKITHSLYHALLEIKCIPVGRGDGEGYG